jgi:hypothetical protein
MTTTLSREFSVNIRNTSLKSVQQAHEIIPFLQKFKAKKGYELTEGGEKLVERWTNGGKHGCLIYRVFPDENNYDINYTWLTDKPFEKIKKMRSGTLYCRSIHVLSLRREYGPEKLHFRPIGCGIVEIKVDDHLF